MVEQRLVAKLLATSAVTDLVGTRIRAMRPRQLDQLPVLVYQRISTTPINTLTGRVGAAFARIQLTAIAESYGEAKAVIDAVRDALAPADQAGWTDATGTPVISACHWLGEYDLGGAREPGGDEMLHEVAADYRIQFA